MKTACLIALLIVTGCNNCGGITPVPAPEPQPGPIVIEPTCEDICSHYRELGCTEGDPTPAGEPCEAWCGNALEVPGFKERFRCIIDASSCDAAGKCE